MPDIRLPNGKIIKGVPSGVSKEDIMEKAIASGLATEQDFASDTNPGFKAAPDDYQKQSGGIADILFGKKGERSVFNAPELNELSMRAFKAGLGGVLTGNVDDIKSIIGENYPEAQFGTINGQQSVRLPSGDYFLQPEGLDAGDVGRFVFDVASFTPAGRVVGTAPKALATGAIAAGATQAAQEGVEAVVGGDFDASDVAIESAMGPVGQIAEPVFKAIGSKAKDAYAYIAEKSTRGADEVAEVGRDIKSGDSRRIIPDLMANQEVIKAAEDLGVDLNPAHYSGNEIYKEYELGLKMLPGSKLSAKEKEAVSALGVKADELIEEFGGTTDKSALSDSVKQTMEDTIEQIKGEERIIYEAIEDAIPKSQKVIPKNTLSYLENRINEVGGVKFLSPAEQSVYKSLSGVGKSRPTYQRLVDARRNVHSPSGLNNPFANTDKRTRDMLYNAMKEDERGVIGFIDSDLLDQYDKALEIGAKRFKAQDEMVKAYGKDLSGSLFKGIKTGAKQASEGSPGAFKKAMQRVPEDLRQQVAVTALNDIFTSGARTSKDFSLGGFVNAWGGIKRNSSSMSEIKKYVPKEAVDRLDKFYLVSKGILDANKKDLNNPSGSTRAFISAMDAEDGILSKLYRVGSKAAVAEGATSSVGLPGAGTVGVIVASVKSAKKKATEAADELLASPEFKRAAKAYIQGDVAGSNKISGAAGATKRWLSNQPPEVKRQVARQGLIAYLSSAEDEEE